MRFEIKDGRQFTADEREAWSELLTASDVAPSPYLTPEFFDAVATVRPSARVLIGRLAGAPVLFFPFHLSGVAGAFGLGHPIGGPVNDVQGVIASADVHVNGRDLLRAAGISLLSLRHAAGHDPVFGNHAGSDSVRHAGHVIDLSAGFAAYEQDRAPLAKSAFKAIRTRLGKGQAQYGPGRHEFWDVETVVYKELEQ